MASNTGQSRTLDRAPRKGRVGGSVLIHARLQRTAWNTVVEDARLASFGRIAAWQVGETLEVLEERQADRLPRACNETRPHGDGNAADPDGW